MYHYPESSGQRTRWRLYLPPSKSIFRWFHRHHHDRDEHFNDILLPPIIKHHHRRFSPSSPSSLSSSTMNHYHHYHLVNIFTIIILLFISTFLSLPHDCSTAVAVRKIGPKKLTNDFYTLDLKMPGVLPQKNDEYFCTATNISEELYITRFDPNADSTRIHHIIIYGCKDIADRSSLYSNYWNCSKSLRCVGMRIIYAWGRNAPPLALPKDVGFHVGLRSDVNYLVLQAHYATPLPEKDYSGVSLLYTLNPLSNIAGIFLMAASEGHILPNKPKVHIDINCMLSRDPIAIFAYRVHAHALGTVITGYKFSRGISGENGGGGGTAMQNGKWTLIAKGNPQWPQAFYPLSTIITVLRDDLLFARCTYNSTGKDVITSIGSTAGDEMCNLYLMYYAPNPLLSINNEQLPNGFSYKNIDTDDYTDRLALMRSFDQTFSRSDDLCEDRQFNKHNFGQLLPNGNDEPLPRNVTLEESARGQHSIHNYAQHNDDGQQQQQHNSHVHGHPMMDSALRRKVSSFKFKLTQSASSPFGTEQYGQVTAIDVDSDDNIVIFHRGKHVWNARSFNMTNHYQLINQGPIDVATVVTIDPSTKNVIEKWGEGLFYLPHGLTIDPVTRSIWLTDVALHQVFKFSLDPNNPKRYQKPLLTLGVRFEPGSDMVHFCKPTSVAVDYQTGDFYVADGYCNSRVMRFDSAGVFKNHWGHAPLYEAIDSFRNAPPPMPPPNVFNVPHKIVLLQNFSSPSSSPSSSSPTESPIACVADRENGRIQCFTTPYGYFRFQISIPEFNGRLFSLAYTPTDGGVLYAVAGPTLFGEPRDVMAFAFDPASKQARSIFAPNSGTFSNPHDIAISHSGTSAYVVEIGPNNIWMFTRDDAFSSSGGNANDDNGGGDDGQESSQQSASAGSPSPPTVNVMKSKIIDSKSGSSSNDDSSSPNANTKLNVRFNFELLRIQSKQFRNAINFNSTLFMVLFVLFAFILLIQHKYSSPHYSLYGFITNMCRPLVEHCYRWWCCWWLCCCCCFRRRRYAPTRIGGGGSPPSQRCNSSIGERMRLGLVLHNRTQMYAKEGFSRLPQNENEAIDRFDYDDDDDSDVLEDFHSLDKSSTAHKLNGKKNTFHSKQSSKLSSNNIATTPLV